MKPHRISLAEVSVFDGDRELAFNQFLDDFYGASEEERQTLISGEPSCAPGSIFGSKLAATAELLCHRFSLSVPAWTEHPCYFVPDPVWATPLVCARSESAREYYKQTTCDEFARRNLFYGPDLLRRC